MVTHQIYLIDIAVALGRQRASVAQGDREQSVVGMQTGGQVAEEKREVGVFFFTLRKFPVDVDAVELMLFAKISESGDEAGAIFRVADGGGEKLAASPSADTEGDFRAVFVLGMAADVEVSNHNGPGTLGVMRSKSTEPSSFGFDENSTR